MSGVGLVDRIEKKFAVMSSEKAESRFLSLVGLTNETEASTPSTPGKVYHLWLKQLFECWTSDCTLSAVRGEQDCLTGAITDLVKTPSLKTKDSSPTCQPLPALPTRVQMAQTGFRPSAKVADDLLQLFLRR